MSNCMLKKKFWNAIQYTPDKHGCYKREIIIIILINKMSNVFWVFKFNFVKKCSFKFLSIKLIIFSKK
jgi:hypothetical protein